MYNSSGVGELVNYIKTNIEGSSDEYLLKVIKESINHQLSREKEINDKIIKDLQEVLENIDKESKVIEDYNYSVKSYIDLALQNWINNEFLIEERDQLLKFTDKKEYMNFRKKYLDEKYIENVIQEKYKNLAEEINSKWQKYSEEFLKQYELLYNNSEISVETDDISVEGEKFKDGLVHGGATGGALAFGLATYSALIGPSAAAISMGTALSVFLPPLLIAGAIGGVVLSIFKKGDSSNKIKADVSKVMESLRNSLKKDIKPEMEKTLNNVSDFYSKLMMSRISYLIFNFEFSNEEINILINELCKHNIEIEEKINELEKIY